MNEISRLKPLVMIQRAIGYSFLVMSLWALNACVSTNHVEYSSENQNSRIRMVVIHHTTSNFQRALDTLTLTSDRPVSSHYLLPEPDDPSYTKKNLKVHALVAEESRAWHAGVSSWSGRTELNDISIGIELVNQTYCHQGEEGITHADGEEAEPFCFYPDFAVEQMDMLLGLLSDIHQRHPDIKPVNIVGHADIAPQRRIDPGPRFPWQRLYRMGFGAWFDDATVLKYWEIFTKDMPSILQLQQALLAYGYPIQLSGVADRQTRNVVRAFQMHFTPSRVTHSFDPQSAAVLFALLEKYRPEELKSLMSELESADQALGTMP